MTGQRLRCAGLPKYDKKASCWELAAWVVQQAGGTWTVGACRHHIHQVLKANTTEHGQCTLWQADTYYRQRDALLAPPDTARAQAEAWLDAVRPLVQDSTTAVTTAATRLCMAQQGMDPLPTLAQTTALLNALVKEGVLEHYVGDSPEVFWATTPIPDYVEPGG